MNTSHEKPSNGSENEPSLEQISNELREQLDAHLANSKTLAESYIASKLELTTQLSETRRSCLQATATAENTRRTSIDVSSRIAAVERKLETWTQAQAPILEILEKLYGRL